MKPRAAFQVPRSRDPRVSAYRYVGSDRGVIGRGEGHTQLQTYPTARDAVDAPQGGAGASEAR